MDFSIFLKLFQFFQVTAPNNNSVILETTGIPMHSSFGNVSAKSETPLKDIDCLESLGCFPTSAPWEGPERPVSLPPEQLDVIKPFFCLHSFRRPKCQKFYWKEKLDLSDLDISSDSYVILLTHGFIHSTESAWMKRLVSSLLKNLESNLRVITLDWRNGATPPYAQAVANIRLLGAVAGHVVGHLVVEKNIKLSQTHLVGHSLGAHMFGYTGSYVTRQNSLNRIGRITGLDPAGPYFRGTSQEVRLDHSDAFFVDIIHTDSTSLIPTLPVSLGLPEATGHIDFFPNGGGEQKGCKKSAQAHILKEKALGKGVLEFINCSHERSHRYLASSVSKRCNYVAVECPSWAEFKEGKCWDCETLRCFKMGFDIHRVYPDPQGKVIKAAKEDFYHIISRGETKVNLYLVTTTNEELCGEQLRFTLMTSASEAAVSQGGEYARFSIVLRGPNGSSETNPRQRAVFLKPGDSLKWVDAVPSKIGEIHSIVVTYEDEKDLLFPLVWRFSPPALHLQQIVVEDLISRKKKVFKFCQEKLTMGEVTILKDKCN